MCELVGLNLSLGWIELSFFCDFVENLNEFQLIDVIKTKDEVRKIGWIFCLREIPNDRM